MIPRVLIVAANAEDMAALRPTRETLDEFGVAWTETLVFADGAGALDSEGVRALVVASSDAALPAALASAMARPVVRVPVAGAGCAGIGLLYDPVAEDLPTGEAPFATVAIGEAGAKNAALLVVSMLGLTDATLWAQWLAFRQRQTDAVLGTEPLSVS